MQKMVILAFVSTLMIMSNTLADSGDDTLNFYLSKSDLVVKGKIINEPDGVEEEVGVVTYHCEFEVSEVLKGDQKLKGKKITTYIVRFESDKSDLHPLMKKGGEMILFLKKLDAKKPVWESTDVWFSIQRPSKWMSGSLKRLVKENQEKKKKKDQK